MLSFPNGVAVWTVLALSLGCGSQEAPGPQSIDAVGSVSDVSVPTSSATTLAPSTPTTATVASSSSSIVETPSDGLRAQTAMKMEGTVAPEKLVAEINRQIAPINRCAALVRVTDKVVGSLNLQITLKADGHVTPELQSPVNEQAMKCLMEGMQSWKIQGAGIGKAMVLLTMAPGA